MNSIDRYDKVKTLNVKPPVSTEGLNGIKHRDSAESDNRTRTFPILSDSPNLSKRKGENMSKIPYLFETPVPKYFRENGFFENENTWKFITWAFSKCSSQPYTIKYDNCDITLQPYEFICGRNKSSSECFLTPKEFRGQLISLSKMHLIKKGANSRANRFSSYIWLVESFSTSKGQPKGQPKGQLRANSRATNTDIYKQENNCIVCADASPVADAPLQKGRQDMILEEYKKIEINHPDGSVIQFSLSDLFTMAVQKRTDWHENEIDELWKILLVYSQPIRDLFKFCNGTIQNLRKISAIKNFNSKEKECKKMEKSQDWDIELSKKPQDIIKECISEKDTLVRPLANWKSDLKKQIN